MLKNMKLGTKIVLGFAALLVLAVTLGGMAVLSMKGVETDAVKLAREYVPEAGLAGQLERRVYRTMYALRGYGYTGDPKYHEQGVAAMAQVRETLGALQDLAQKAVHLTRLKGSLGEAVQAMDEYDRLMVETRKNLTDLEEIRKEMDAKSGFLVEGLQQLIREQNRLMAEEIAEGAQAGSLRERLSRITLYNDVMDLSNEVRIANWRAQTLRQPQIIEETIKRVFPSIERKVGQVADITSRKGDLDQLKGIEQHLESYQEAMRKVMAVYSEMERINQARVVSGTRALEVSRNLAVAASEHTAKIANEAQQSLSTASRVMLVGLFAALIIGLVTAVFLTRSITAPIRRVIAGLTEGADQVASASTQVSSASQSLAEGAGEQAAAIEETSSSLEEMASMTRQNAENARQADALMGEARRVIDTASVSMNQLGDSMVEITRASEDTSKIIKTIDEIAFQTNLLALNAAVEAARAGEAGAGFAVVADEVRNLAMRAAEAARNTADLIEGTVKKVKDGSSLMQQANEAFQQVAGSAGKVAELVGEISAASSEQAQGIEQINRAVTEMDKVTQQNAANAEESAAASEQMNAQAETMKDMVGELVVMVGAAQSKARRSGRAAVEELRSGNVDNGSSRPALPARRPIARSGNGKARQAMLPPSTPAERRSGSRSTIPMEADGFSEF